MSIRVVLIILLLAGTVSAAEPINKDIQILELQKELSEAKTTIMQLQAIIQSVHSDQYQIEMNKQRQINDELQKAKGNNKEKK